VPRFCRKLKHGEIVFLKRWRRKNLWTIVDNAIDLNTSGWFLLDEFNQVAGDQQREWTARNDNANSGVLPIRRLNRDPRDG
jgi:hypothetical protein